VKSQTETTKKQQLCYLQCLLDICLWSEDNWFRTPTIHHASIYGTTNPLVYDT